MRGVVKGEINKIEGWRWRDIVEQEVFRGEARINLNLLVHIAAVVFGPITGESDDMICSGQD